MLLASVIHTPLCGAPHGVIENSGAQGHLYVGSRFNIRLSARLDGVTHFVPGFSRSTVVWLSSSQMDLCYYYFATVNSFKKTKRYESDGKCTRVVYQCGEVQLLIDLLKFDATT